MPSATIKIFLVNGNPKRLRTAELSNWTGKAVAGPRSEFEGIITREESNSTGVYFLTGNDPSSGDQLCTLVRQRASKIVLKLI